MNFRHHRRRRNPTEVNLTPLIDIVFNLLIFFLITTTFVQSTGIDVELPKASAAPSHPQHNSIIIAVTAEGRFVHEGTALAADELEEKLRARHADQSDAMVIIQADTTTHHGKVVEVMDMARKVGFSRLAIAAEAQE